ncbi:MAG: transposase [Cytophagales bacterium]|nr:transposase [Cytophagales bacterium]
MREKNKPYPEQFRLQMVELVKAGKKPRELAIEFGCHETSITAWVRHYAGGTPSTVTPTANEREELIQLRRKLRQVEAKRPPLKSRLHSKSYGRLHHRHL